MLLNRCALLLLAVVALGCSRKDQAAESADTAAAAPAMMAGDSMPGMNHSSMQGMANMTGDSDRDFERMMSDHHSGLIAMAQEAKGKGGATVKKEATRMEAAQSKELEDIKGDLSKTYQDNYEPSIMPDNKAMLDELKSLSGAAYDKKFFENVIRHHEQALKMVNDYLPTAKRADIRTMAERMKADQTKEIAKVRGMLAEM